MSVLERILEILQNNNVPFEKLEHDTVYTSQDAAKIRDTDVSIGAKALIFFADKVPIMLVLPGDKKADLKSFKREFSVKDLRMATPEEVYSFTGLKVGSIPPFGNLLVDKTYFDVSIREKHTVVFNAGAHTTSVKMAASDLISLVKPVFGKYAI